MAAAGLVGSLDDGFDIFSVPLGHLVDRRKSSCGILVENVGDELCQIVQASLNARLGFLAVRFPCVSDIGT